MAVKLGRLKQLGITEFWQVPLNCPVEYKDFTRIQTHLDKRLLIDGSFYVFVGQLFCAPSTKWKNKKPRTQFVISDTQKNTVAFSMFGDTRDFVDGLDVGDDIAVCGYVMQAGNNVYINNAELVPLEVLNTIMPVYKGVPKKIRPENVRKLIAETLDIGVEEAANKLRQILTDNLPKPKIRRFVNCASMNLEQVLYALHKPQSMEQAKEAYSVIERISHLVAANELIKRSRQDDIIKVEPIIGTDYKKLTSNIPFKLTEEQAKQVSLATEDIKRGNLLKKR